MFSAIEMIVLFARRAFFLFDCQMTSAQTPGWLQYSTRPRQHVYVILNRQCIPSPDARRSYMFVFRRRFPFGLFFIQIWQNNRNCAFSGEYTQYYYYDIIILWTHFSRDDFQSYFMITMMLIRRVSHNNKSPPEFSTCVCNKK